MSQGGYIPGDFWRICDVCGFKTRASQTQKRWDGLMVCHKDWEPRHPQDNVRARPDKQVVPNPRPEAADTFVGDDALYWSDDALLWSEVNTLNYSTDNTVTADDL